MDLVRNFRKLTRSLGVVVRKYGVSSSDEVRLALQLKYKKIDLVFDIGANTGQFAENLFDLGYLGEIISFEPMSKEHNLLVAKSQHQPKWKIYERCAIGNSNSESEINISKNSYSSSLLPMLDAHRNGAPESKYIDVEKVKVIPLDDVCKKLDLVGKKIFLKIDVQGFEAQVLEGAQVLLSKCTGVQIEVSLVPLYEGTKLFLKDHLDYFENLGFELFSINPEFTDPVTGRVLQCDATFFRK